MEWLIRYGGSAENVPGYDCSSSDRRNGTTSHTIGTVFITFGIIGEVVASRLFEHIVYALDMMVMVKKKYRAFSCYKIMIALGICDMSAIFVLCILGGYFWMYYNCPHVVNNLVIMTVICALSMLYYRSVSRLSDIGNRLLRWVQKSVGH
ncbi:hypothetical protein ANCDUO_06508 [Ancylostoma duodenale]|uniref:Uncharacterized protein n=1 Tax=Ancylostoma duodenale TaxID=51022 RepID=A0A0C2DKT5_9BILA|nr:hypothetical protein ANCDUO_06508 [Ancylostoma duodenale]